MKKPLQIIPFFNLTPVFIPVAVLIFTSTMNSINLAGEQLKVKLTPFI